MQQTHHVNPSACLARVSRLTVYLFALIISERNAVDVCYELNSGVTKGIGQKRLVVSKRGGSNDRSEYRPRPD